MPPKKRRRPRGEGAFYRRASDGLWIGAVVYEDEHGQKRRATVSSSDKTAAMQKLRALRSEIDSGTYTPSQGMTLGSWLTYWLDNIVKGSVEPKTFAGYRQVAQNQILAGVGETRRLPVTPALVRANLRWVAEKWSPRMAQLAYVVWNRSMQAAVHERVIRENPCAFIEKPKGGAKTEGKALTADQARRVLMSALEAGDPMFSRWAFALICGARQAECLGLRWQSLSLDDATADLSWQIQALPLKPGASLDDPNRFDVAPGADIIPAYGKFAWKRPKTQRSKRLVPLPPPLVAALREHRKVAPVNDLDLVWASPKGRPIQPKADNTAWTEALKRAGVPIVRLHDARHTAATLLQELGYEESVRMQILGHSTVAASRVYAHTDLEAARKALGRLGGLLELG